jgi:RNA polymerase sigma-70 factor (ECF subfamily)
LLYREDKIISDWELINGIKNGNKYMFEELIRKYQKSVYKLILGMVKDENSANEIMQESFIKVYYAIPRFREGDELYPWIRKIAVNLCLKHFRYQKKFVPIRSENIMPTNENNPLDCIEFSELKTKLEESIDALPIKYKSVFTLRIYQHMSYREISNTLRLPYGTVMSRIARAREILRNILAPYMRR